MTKLPFLWQVKKNGAVSYLLGTSHIKGGNPLTEELAKNLVTKARAMYVETPEDFKLQPRHFTLPNNQTINDILNQDEIDSINNFFRGHYEKFLYPNEIEDELRYRNR